MANNNLTHQTSRKAAPVKCVTKDRGLHLGIVSEVKKVVSAQQPERARIVLMAANGELDVAIAAKLSITNQKAASGRAHFLALGLLASKWMLSNSPALRASRPPR